jgi:hypothetical protein
METKQLMWLSFTWMKGSKWYIHKQHQRLSTKMYAMQLFVVYRQVSFYTIYLCANLLESYLKIYTTFQILVIILGLTQFVKGDTGYFLF